MPFSFLKSLDGEGSADEPNNNLQTATGVGMNVHWSSLFQVSHPVFNVVTDADCRKLLLLKPARICTSELAEILKLKQILSSSHLPQSASQLQNKSMNHPYRPRRLRHSSRSTDYLLASGQQTVKLLHHPRSAGHLSTESRPRQQQRQK